MINACEYTVRKPDMNEILRTDTCVWENRHGINIDVKEIGCVGVYLISLFPVEGAAAGILKTATKYLVT